MATALACVALIGCRASVGDYAATTTPMSSPGQLIPTESAATPSTPTGTSQAPLASASGASGTDIDTAAQAATALRDLTEVAQRPYRPGYQRSCSAGAACSFGPEWTDDTNSEGGHNGCSTRDDVLAATLRDVHLLPGSRCVVVAGILDDPYTGGTITFSKAHAVEVPLDHVVPLELAWDLGAADWTQQQRVDYANDPLVLLAVDEASNTAKSASGPGEWMPPNRGFWCAYDQRIVTILTRYHLEVTAADSSAMQQVLRRC